jgi:hypothetical protein
MVPRVMVQLGVAVLLAVGVVADGLQTSWSVVLSMKYWWGVLSSFQGTK